VHRIAAEGFKQVTLLGQNVNSYRCEQHDFADLMQMVAERWHPSRAVYLAASEGFSAQAAARDGGQSEAL
jgi:tRNA A37 methylthiotransferase MiaB